MRHFSLLLVTAIGGCTLYFGGGDDGPIVCPEATPTAAPAPLRDPGDLTCDSYGGSCDPNCGPCPLREAPALAPAPSYNYCGHVCETLDEGACAVDPACRVVKDAACVLGPNPCFTDFLGCFPTDLAPDASIDCWNADAWSCSRSNACTALHSIAACDPVTGECPRPFELCVPEGQDPGMCGGAVVCDRIPPVCPTGTTPGILNGCYTNACIPTSFCPVR